MHAWLKAEKYKLQVQSREEEKTSILYAIC